MHESHVSEGSPYNHMKKITCPDCIDSIKAQRAALCGKYGWAEWPNDLKGSIEGE